MVEYQKIFDQLCSQLNKKLTKDLLDEYIAIKHNYYLQTNESYELAMNKSGKFAETVFQLLKNIISGAVVTRPNFEVIEKELLQTQKDKYPESIRKIIPKMTKAIYSIRSERGAAHKSEVSPNYIDCTIIVGICDWIMAELLRLYSSSSPTEIEEILHTLVDKKIPFIEEFEDGSIVILKESSFRGQILLALYHLYPKRIARDELKKKLKPKYPQLLTSNLGDLEDEKLVHQNERGATLTKRGLNFIEREVLDQPS